MIMGYQGFGDGSPPPSASPSSSEFTTAPSRSSLNYDQLRYRKASKEWLPRAHEYSRCSSCSQIICSCVDISGPVAGHEAGATQMDWRLANVYSGPPRYWEEGWLATQLTDNVVEGQLYDRAERQTGDMKNAADVAVQDAPLPQYSNTSRVLYPSQNAPSDTWKDSSLGTPVFNSNDQSNFTTTQEDHDMIDSCDQHEDYNTVNCSEQQDPEMKLCDLEARYQPCPCLLEGCRKGYVFETFQSFRSHIKNVHSKATWCNFPSCPHPRPFANKTDLKRHTAAKHDDKSDKPYKCLREDCPARVMAFKRKDKLKEHDRKYHHAQYACFFCPRWFESFRACAQHTNMDHINDLNRE